MRAKVVMVNVAVFAVLFELFGLAAYYYDTGHFFYTHRKAYPAAAALQPQRLTREGLHPYFGPTHDKGIPFELPEQFTAGGRTFPGLATNNFGFIAAGDYPIAAPASDAIVGIFGGSVAVWFCQVGAPRLAERLQAAGPLAGRRVIPLCFAHEGYKQPQQLQVLSYFLSIGQRLDLVINIDGFNEVALGRMNDERGWDVSMPSAPHLDGLIALVDQAALTPGKAHSLAAIARYRERLAELPRRIERNPLASINFVLDQWYTVTEGRYRRELARFAELPASPAADSLISVTPRTPAASGNAGAEQAAETWLRASVLMHELLSARGVPYFHFLQPNQYATARRFGEAEARVALNPASPFRAGAADGYPQLHARAVRLRERGVRFFDASGVFDNTPVPVYMDDCCHYTLAGNDLLGDFIAGTIVAAR